MEILWSKATEDKFNEIIDALPQFHKNIARQLVKQKAEELARARNSVLVEERDLILAFFEEVPPAFKDMMVRLFHRLNIDYNKFIKSI